ncbi:uncharacterized protein HKW66_Vig0231260 [Vigna angularis]|uniref:Uncharacterized protein n=1 Tax=Phaseolus angularis TaxID=3914 RepID=A0A8T0KB86_PHAAN|nr:uncharacterized protein HKW66_Vig0231260 [Vigna angularis]
MGFGKCFADPCIGSPLQRLLGASNDSVAASNDCTDASRCCSLSPSTAASNDVASSFAASNHFRWCLHLIALRVVHLAASNDASALSIAAPTAASNDHGAFIFVAVRVVYLAASNDVSALLLPPPLPPFAAALFLSFPSGENPSGPIPFFPSLFHLLFSPTGWGLPLLPSPGTVVISAASPSNTVVSSSRLHLGFPQHLQ